MRHAIIGAGNLGLDLANEVNTRGLGSATVYSRSRGFELCDFEALKRLLGAKQKPDCVWVCCGGGGTAEAKRDFREAELFHVAAPLVLLKNAHPETKVVLFSTDHAACELANQRPDRTNNQASSAFARLKVELEDRVTALNRPNTLVVRLGSLYGYHKPEATFPGRMIAGFGFCKGKIRLPLNSVTPTPTMWAAGMMIRHFAELFDSQRPTRHHLAPAGTVTIRDWAASCLFNLRFDADFDKYGYYEPDRPAVSAIGCSFVAQTSYWYDVWKSYFYRPRFTPKAYLSRLVEADSATLAYS